MKRCHCSTPGGVDSPMSWPSAPLLAGGCARKCACRSLNFAGRSTRHFQPPIRSVAPRKKQRGGLSPSSSATPARPPLLFSHGCTATTQKSLSILSAGILRPVQASYLSSPSRMSCLCCLQITSRRVPVLWTLIHDTHRLDCCYYTDWRRKTSLSH